MMDVAIAPTIDALDTANLTAPEIPIMSTVNGSWLSVEDATSVQYWGRNLRDTVLFADAIAKLLEEGFGQFLVVGPGQTLSTLANQCASAGDDMQCLASLPHAQSEESDREALLSAFGRLWIAGRSIDWAKTRSAPGRRVPLPTYPFDRKRHWVDPTQSDGRNQIANSESVAQSADTLETSRQVIEQQLAVLAAQLQIFKKM